MSEYIVRQVRLEEVSYLVSMGKRMHAESLFKDMEYDENKVYRMAHAAAEGFGFFNVIVHMETEVPVGMLLAYVTMSFFGRDLVGNDLVLVVEPEHRGRCGHELKQLIGNYHIWAKHMGAKRVYLGSSTGIDPERTAKLFESCGFKQIGTLHEA